MWALKKSAIGVLIMTALSAHDCNTGNIAAWTRHQYSHASFAATRSTRMRWGATAARTAKATGSAMKQMIKLNTGRPEPA